MFGGSPSRNMASPFESGLPTTWVIPQDGEKPKNLLWHAQLGSITYGGPVITGGRVFIGTNNQHPRDRHYVNADGRPVDLGVLMCFRQQDGKFLWQAVHPKLAAGRVNDWPLQGLPSMPAVDGDRLYYVSNRCELICADVATGRATWRLDMIGQLKVFPHNLAACSPLVVGDLVFVVTGNGVDEDHIEIPSPQAPSFLAVNKQTGRVVWQDNSPTATLAGVNLQGQQRAITIQALRNRGELLLHGQWSNPVYADVGGQAQVVFPGGDGWLRAFEPRTGRLLWKFDCNPKAARWALGGQGTRSDFIATPVVHEGRLYIGVGQEPELGPGEGHLWCIDLSKAVTNGRLNNGKDVSPVGDNFDPSAAVNRRSALAWHYGGPVPKADLAKVRRNAYFGRTLSSCAVHAGLVYAADLAGYLHCLDADTGEVYWTHDLGEQTWSSPYYADGKVYIGTDREVVWVFSHGKDKRILAQNEMPATVRGVAVAVNGVLYIATRSDLYAVAERR
jgi:outer membrane protein assembly factor BamB